MDQFLERHNLPKLTQTEINTLNRLISIKEFESVMNNLSKWKVPDLSGFTGKFYQIFRKDHELLTAKFRLKLKKVGKITRPFRYDLNQIPYDYTVKMKNRFKGLDLTDRVPEELWMEVHDIVQEAGIKTIPKKKKCRKAKWLSEEALQVAEKRREAKGK